MRPDRGKPNIYFGAMTMRCPPPKTAISALFTLAMLLCCNRETEPGAPIDTVMTLLELHGLKGRLPQDRPRELVDQPIPRENLLPLFVDLEFLDPFIGDLYTGFVVGALSRHQDRLFETRSDDRATFGAGQAVIHLKRENGIWKILLEASIPEALKDQAQAEKARYENAKAAGKAAAP
jgi:hypothetical protein